MTKAIKDKIRTKIRIFWLYPLLVFIFFLCYIHLADAEDFTNTLLKVKPSVVGVGTFQTARQPQSIVQGSGFVIGNGQYIFTNQHVLPEGYSTTYKESLSVFHGSGDNTAIYPVTVVAESKETDLALLKLNNDVHLPTLQMASMSDVKEGMAVAITGFPFGSSLGFFPVTHRGIVSALPPIAVPAPGTKALSAHRIRELDNPYTIIQLDIVAYPGNSGSAVYDVETGKVLGILNSTFIKSSKEEAISSPTGISFAIPVSAMQKMYDTHMTNQKPEPVSNN